MSKSDRLEPLANLAGIRESEAARELADCLAELRSKETELEQLRAYLEEYAKPGEASNQSVDSLRWRNAQQFIGRLSEAIEVQESELKRVRDRFRAEAEKWRASHRHAKAVERLLDKYYREELKEMARREQHELDELVLRLTR